MGGKRMTIRIVGLLQHLDCAAIHIRQSRMHFAQNAEQCYLRIRESFDHRRSLGFRRDV